MSFMIVSTMRWLLPALLVLPLLSALAAAHAAPLMQPQVQTVGRVVSDAGGWHATWPGVTLTTRFRGRAIGIVVDDPLSGYTVELDGTIRHPLALVANEHTVWLRGLSNGSHELRLTRRNETTSAPGAIRGFLLENGTWLPSKAGASRQIEFIGDSFTAGLANLSKKRSCNAATIRATSDATATFGVRVARHFHANWEINAMSGMGMVRNWNGNLPGENFRTYYPRLLQNDAQSKADDANWHPQLIVIGLGINDFSTPLHEGEAWTRDTLAQQFKESYRSMLAELRQRYGQVEIIATAVRVGAEDQQGPLVQQVVDSARADGDLRVHYLEYEGLQLTACQWHPNLADHARMARALIDKIDAVNPFPSTRP
ncbi:MAG TPA: SGNH/GDSL hydrolase family protein [Burkholderiaceae bacterium]